MMLNFFHSMKEVFEKFVENESSILKNIFIIHETIQEIETFFISVTNKSILKMLKNEIKRENSPITIIENIIRESEIDCNLLKLENFILINN